jgi:hypothetical protein
MWTSNYLYFYNLSKTFNQETVPNSTLFIDTYKVGMK